VKTECSVCSLEYDDEYRWTFCPHDEFEMNTTVVAGGRTVVVHSIEELHEALKGEGAP
jgi:hypothetical protein